MHAIKHTISTHQWYQELKSISESLLIYKVMFIYNWTELCISKYSL